MSPAPRVVPLFETPIYISDDGLAALRPRLLRFARALQRRDPAGTSRSNVRGWHSRGNLFEETDPIVRELELALRSHVNAYLGRLCPRRRRRCEFGMDAWVNVNERGSSNSRHVHPNAFLSGAYYVNAPERMRSAELVVWDPRGPKTIMHGAFSGDLELPWLHDSFTIDVRTGRTLIFPAWLEHEVTPLEENVKRISIGFNVRRPS